MYDLITQGVTIALVIYFGLHHRTQLRTQKAAIEVQAESIKAQSTVLQDVERHSKIMQQVIDFFDPQAQLHREQAYKDRVDRNLKVLEDEMAKIRQEWVDAQTMSRSLLLLLNKASDCLSEDNIRFKEARLDMQESDRVLQEARLVMQESNRELEKYMRLVQKLKAKSPEDKTRDQPHASPGRELTAGPIPDQP